MPPVIPKVEKKLMYAFVIIADIFLAITTPFVGINNAIDVFVGLFLVGYGIKRKLWTPYKMVMFAIYFTGEQIPGLDVAPFWTLDLKNLYSGTTTEVPVPDMKVEDLPLNIEAGIRRPRKRPPLNSGERREPRV